MRYRLNLEKPSADFLDGLDKKQFKQVMVKVLRLLAQPHPPDSKKLGGVEGGWRADQGEFRILYTVDEDKKEVRIWKIGKRNSDEVYRNI